MSSIGLPIPQLRDSLAVFWFRRDLRLYDNHGLHAALKSGLPILPIFIFDPEITDLLEDRDDRRLSLIFDALTGINQKLYQSGSSLLVLQGEPKKVFGQLCEELDVKAVYANEDYEPYAIRRDKEVGETLASQGIDFRLFKDQVILGPEEVIKEDGSPYTVYTPYSRKWKSRLETSAVPDFQVRMDAGLWAQFHTEVPTLMSLGFTRKEYTISIFPPPLVLLKEYADNRNIPGIEGTSRLGPLLRFGIVSVREAVRLAVEQSETWLNELIWREFFMQILWHFPHVENGSFRKEYDRIPWRNDPDGFHRWTEGITGFPIVDAGMRELKDTGFMHNRVRMITASFLAKHLLIDWRLGEAWFARHLLDFELASNNGNWQWAAGSGCDAAPYFRIFNPWTQQEKFDAQKSYIRRWIPEFTAGTYPAPMVDHGSARIRCLETYKKGLGK